MFRQVLLWLIVCTAVASAQAPRGGGANAVETKHLTATPSVSQSAGRITLNVDIVPKAKMHVYAPEQKDYIPVSLTLTAVEGLRPGPAQFPKAEKLFFQALNETQLVYSKPFRIIQPVTLTTKPSAPVTLKGTLRYQACDDSICYLPQNVEVAWTIR